MISLRLTLASLVLFAATALAQSPPPPAATPPSSPAPTPQAPAPASDIKQPVRERERSIFIPYEQLEQVFKDHGTGVFLPYREFLDLWNELTLKRDEAKDPPPPSDGVVSKAEYTGRVEGQTLVLDAKISAESFKKGWITLPLSADLTGGIAEASTGKAVLRPKDKGCDLLLPDKGVYEITLKLMLPVDQSAGRFRTLLALPAAAVSRLVITIPGEGLEFEVKPGAAFTTRPLPGQTELSFFFGASSAKPELTWGAPQGVTQMTPLLLAETKIESTLGPGSIATTASFDFRILRAPLGEFKVSLPAGQEVLGVTGDNVKTWNVAANGARQQLIVTPDKPVKDSYAFKLQMEGPVTALPAEVHVPDFQIEGASYARGNAAIFTEPQFDVTPKTQEAVVRANTSTEARTNLLAAGSFRILKQPYKLSLNVEEAKPQVEVSSLARLEIQRDAMKVEAEFKYNVRRVGIFETRIALPAGLNVSSVTGSQVAEWKVETANNAPTLLIKLPQQKTGEFAFKVEGRQLRAQPTEDAAVPVFTPQGATRHEAKIGVGIHSSLEATTKNLGDLQQEDVSSLPASMTSVSSSGAVDPFAPAPALGNDKPLFSPSGNELSLAFRYRDTAKPATLAFKSRDAQVSVEVLTLVEAKEQSTRHQWQLSFDVSYAAVDRVVIAVPKSVAGEIRFIDPAVKETHKEYQATEAELKLPDAANYVFWEVVLRSEKLGRFMLSLSHVKQGALEAGKTGKVELLQVHAPGAFQESGQVAVLKDNNLELRNAQPEGLEEIDARELNGHLQQPGVFQAYKYRALPVKLVVETAKNAYFAVPQAVIAHADLTTAVATDEAQSTEAIYWIKNIDLQFLIVKLPKNARLVSDIFVGREAQQPMKREGSDDLMIRLPSGGSSNRDAFPVRFVFESPSTHPGEKLGSMGSLPVQPPQVSDVKVFETRHQLYLPQTSHYTRFDGPLTQAQRDQGWNRARRLLRYVLPSFGASLSDSVIATLSTAQSNDTSGGSWTNPPEVPPEVRTLYDFQVPRQGQKEVLRRLGPPAETIVHFRSRTVTFVCESIAFLLVIAGGIAAMRWKGSHKFAAVIVAGTLGMLALGVLSPSNSLIAIAWMRALMCVVGFWIILAFCPVLCYLGSRFKSRPRPPSLPQPPKPAPGPVPSPAPAAPAAPAVPVELPEVKDETKPNS